MTYLLDTKFQQELLIDVQKEFLISLESNLHDVIQRALTARARQNRNSARTQGGATFYFTLVQELRENLKLHGFEPQVSKNVELAINEEKKIRIYVCKGDENTGILSASPCSSSSKGIFTLEYLNLKISQASEIQYPLFNVDPPEAYIAHNQDFEDDEYSTWILLHRFIQGRSVQCELTRALHADCKGFISGFDLNSRILLNTHEENVLKINSGKEPQFNPKIDLILEENV